MTEPINLQVNILQGQELPRVAQASKDVGTHQMMGQEMNRAKESEEAPETVADTGDAEQARLSKDGSGRGRAFLRQKRKKQEEEQAEEEAAAGKTPDATRGQNVDFMR